MAIQKVGWFRDFACIGANGRLKGRLLDRSSLRDVQLVFQVLIQTHPLKRERQERQRERVHKKYVYTNIKWKTVGALS